MDYEKNVCPYDVGQLLTAKGVIEWAFEQDSQIPNNVHSQTIFDIISDCIMNEIVRQLRIKRFKILDDFTTIELEQELESRKSK